MKNKEITKEIWKSVVGYEEYYEVSNYGNIKSVDKRIKNRYSTRFMPSKILKPYKSNKGYLQVRLYKNKLNKNCFVHRIVAETFIPNLNN